MAKPASVLKLRHPNLDHQSLEQQRTVCDLRIMHGKVDELYHVFKMLQGGRHSETDLIYFADPVRLEQNISHVDEIYLWFIKLKDEFHARARKDNQEDNLEGMNS